MGSEEVSMELSELKLEQKSLRTKITIAETEARRMISMMDEPLNSLQETLEKAKVFLKEAEALNDVIIMKFLVMEPSAAEKQSKKHFAYAEKVAKLEEDVLAHIDQRAELQETELARLKLEQKALRAKITKAETTARRMMNQKESDGALRETLSRAKISVKEADAINDNIMRLLMDPSAAEEQYKKHSTYVTKIARLEEDVYTYIDDRAMQEADALENLTFRKMALMTSCCCCSMRLGTILIAVIYMIASAVILTGLGFFLSYFDLLFKPLLGFIMYDIPLNSTTSKHETYENLLSSTFVIKKIIISCITLQTFYFLLCIMLLIGAKKERSGFLSPWLFVEFFRQLVFFAAFCFMCWCTSMYIPKANNYDWVIFILCCALMFFFIGLTFYLWLAVIAASQQFQNKKQKALGQRRHVHDRRLSANF